MLGSSNTTTVYKKQKYLIEVSLKLINLINVILKHLYTVEICDKAIK